MNGLLVIDKPSGPTSHDVVDRIRRLLGERRIGHTGTLDPAASGVLPLVVGRATRLARFLSASDKTYEADIRLGVATDTYDADGAATGAVHSGAWPGRDEVAAALESFRGRFSQQPPAFSAKKIHGRRSYDLARDRSILRPLPVAVTVHALELVDATADRVSLRIDCSAGFYVRSLAHDLGRRLGTGAHLAGLRRTRSGDFNSTDALALARAEGDRELAIAAVIPLERMLPSLSAVVLTEEGATQLQVTLAGPDEDGRRELAVYSLGEDPGGEAGEWMRHASGVLAPAAGAEAPLAGEAWPPEGAEHHD